MGQASITNLHKINMHFLFSLIILIHLNKFGLPLKKRARIPYKEKKL